MANFRVNPISFFTKKAARFVFRKLPAWEVNNERVLNAIKWSGQHISSPQNRLILGITALMSQPFIDLYNKRVDEETRKVSAARTTAKIIAGTTTGFLVRYYAIKLVDAFTKAPKDAVHKWQSFMFPKILETTQKGIQQHKLAIGTSIAIAVMMFTNFLIDAPLTQLLTNVFVKKIKNIEKSKIDKIVQQQEQNKTDTKYDQKYFIKRPTFDAFTQTNKRKEVKNDQSKNSASII